MKINYLYKSSKNKYYFITAVSFLIIISATFTAGAEYVLQGEEIIFVEEDGLVIFEGNSSFLAEDFSVQADRFEVNTRSKTLTAFDNVVINSEQDELRGESLEYNYELEKGTFYGVQGRLDEIYFSGAELNLFSTSPVEGKLTEAEFTPCSRKEAHYHFKAKEIRINSDNTLTIHHIVPYIANIPVFYLPYYTVTYDPEAGADRLSSTFPLPELGYDSNSGLTVEFSYPYQLAADNRGKIYYWKTGSAEERDEIIEFTNKHDLSQNLTFKNRYYYSYDYDFEDEVFKEEEEGFSTSLAYSRGRFALEAGLIRDLMAAEAADKIFVDGSYRFQNGLNTAVRKEYGLEAEEFIKTVYRTDYRFQTGIEASLRREYSSQELIKENYSFSNSEAAVKWNLKYIDGEDYNYYPYLDLSFPDFFTFKPVLGFGKVENGGIKLNKFRLNLNYDYSLALAAGISYYLKHNYRLDHYSSGYDQNYHFSALNTGLNYRGRINSKLTFNSSLFYERNSVFRSSPLPDDREEEKELLKPALSLDLQGDYPDSAWAVESDGSYDLINEEWEEINLKLRKKEDCFDFFIGYEFIEESINFGLSL